jgi:hypothetical protein
MRTYNLTDSAGNVIAFEVSNLLLGRRGAYKVASKVPGSRVTKRPPLFGGGEEFCEFEVDGELFVISEPFGDNSRYWVGANPPQPSKAFHLVRQQFEMHHVRTISYRNAFAVALLMGTIALGFKSKEFFAQDKCLDSGGRWNTQASRCEK